MSDTVFCTTPDGVDLLVRDWRIPSGVPRRGAALIVHGVGEHSDRYDHVADALIQLGIHTRSYDQRGFGRSGGPKGQIPTQTALVDDAKFIYGRLALEASAHEARPPFLLAHSMGGGVAARAVTGGWIAPGGLILSSPAIEPVISPARRALLPILAAVAPNAAFPHGIRPEQLTHDPAVIEAVTHDPFMHDRVTPRLVMSMVDAGRRARADAATVAVPTLVLVAGDDTVVSPDKAEAFARAIPAALGTVHRYPGLFHEIFNEKEPDRSRVLGDLRTWLAGQI